MEIKVGQTLAGCGLNKNICYLMPVNIDCCALGRLEKCNFCRRAGANEMGRIFRKVSKTVNTCRYTK